MVNITANLTDILSPGQIGKYLWTVMPDNILNDLSFVLLLTKTAGVLFLIYLVFLIIQAILKIRSALRIKSIEKNVTEINKKLDLIVDKNTDAKKKDAKETKDKSTS